MPELFTVHPAAKVRCFAPKAVLDALTTPAGALRGRIAPDEVVLVGAPGTASALLDHCKTALAGLGPSALIVDHTDGWSFYSLTGEGHEDVFARVSMLPLPAAGTEPVFFMGRIADMAAKAFRRPGRVDFMTGMETIRHVTEKLEHAGHDRGLHLVPAPDNDPVGVSQ